MVADLKWLRQHPDALARMRQASAAISRPEAAAEIAGLLADLGGLPSRAASVSSLPATGAATSER
jgi:hypothetical protein